MQRHARDMRTVEGQAWSTVGARICICRCVCRMSSCISSEINASHAVDVLDRCLDSINALWIGGFFEPQVKQAHRLHCDLSQSFHADCRIWRETIKSGIQTGHRNHRILVVCAVAVSKAPVPASDVKIIFDNTYD